MKLDEGYIRFQAPKVSFIFPAKQDEIEDALTEENPVVLQGGDKLIGAKLYLTFGLDGKVQEVTYHERALVFPKTVKCLNLSLVPSKN